MRTMALCSSVGFQNLDGTTKVLQGKDKTDTTTLYQKSVSNFLSILNYQQVYDCRGGQRKVLRILNWKKEWKLVLAFRWGKKTQLILELLWSKIWCNMDTVFSPVTRMRQSFFHRERKIDAISFTVMDTNCSLIMLFHSIKWGWKGSSVTLLWDEVQHYVK